MRDESQQSARWYLLLEDQRHGPFSLAQVRNIHASGVVTPYTLARLHPEGSWREVVDDDTLKLLFQPQPNDNPPLPEAPIPPRTIWPLRNGWTAKRLIVPLGLAASAILAGVAWLNTPLTITPSAITPVPSTRPEEVVATTTLTAEALADRWAFDSLEACATGATLTFDDSGRFVDGEGRSSGRWKLAGDQLDLLGRLQRGAHEVATVRVIDDARLHLDVADKPGWTLHRCDTGRYRMPGSDTRRLAGRDLAGMTASQLRLARHEILARRGQIFEDAALKAHFSRKTWYTPSTQPSPLSEIEAANVAFIARLEPLFDRAKTTPPKPADRIDPDPSLAAALLAPLCRKNAIAGATCREVIHPTAPDGCPPDNQTLTIGAIHLGAFTRPDLQEAVAAYTGCAPRTAGQGGSILYQNADRSWRIKAILSGVMTRDCLKITRQNPSGQHQSTLLCLTDTAELAVVDPANSQRPHRVVLRSPPQPPSDSGFSRAQCDKLHVSAIITGFLNRDADPAGSVPVGVLYAAEMPPPELCTADDADFARLAESFLNNRQYRFGIAEFRPTPFFAGGPEGVTFFPPDLSTSLGVVPEDPPDAAAAAGPPSDEPDLCHFLHPPTIKTACAAAAAQADQQVIIQKTALDGNASAQFTLGLLLLDGVGVPKGREKALFWFRKSAAQGFALAQYNLGSLLLDDAARSSHQREAVSWLRRAADQNVIEALNALAYATMQGKGTPRNPNEAARLFRLAAEKGSASSQYNLSLLLTSGTGEPKDPREALLWLRRAAEQGHEAATTLLREMESQ